MTDGGCHFPDLTIFAFNQFQRDPAIGNILAVANGRIAWRNLRLWIEDRGAARESLVSLNGNAAFQLLERIRGRNAFHLRPVNTSVSISRMKKAFVQRRFVT